MLITKNYAKKQKVDLIYLLRHKCIQTSSYPQTVLLTVPQSYNYRKLHYTLNVIRIGTLSFQRNFLNIVSTKLVILRPPGYN